MDDNGKTTEQLVDELSGLRQRVAELERYQADRQQMMESLERSEQRFRLAFENANIGMCLVDEEGRLTKVNQMMCDIFGHAREQLEGMTVNDIAHPEDRETSPTFIRRAVLGEVTHTTFEKRYFHKQGHIVWGLVTSSLVRDSHGAPPYFISHVQDITEQKCLAEALRESQRRFRDLIETTSDWVWEVDEAGVYTYASPRVYDLLGVGPEEVLGRTPFDFMPPDERQRVASQFASIIAQQAPFIGLENINQHKDGRLIVVETNGIPFFDQAGKLRGYRGIDRDITDRKRAEKERDRLIEDLQTALAEVKTLRGILPICASCKKIRDDRGNWNQIEEYVRDRTEADFSHGICPECAKKLYPGFKFE